ncbi:MAG TPA: DNRLRE domain-containing protein [Anaerolineales bacterium]|nr:DNRLRE domain-containing protein [Anaerolineales bacterium]
MRPISFQSLRSYISIVLLIALVWISFGSAKLPGTLAVVLADSDPVIAAAGDIACDPANTNFNNGEGNQSSCRQKYTSELLMNANLAAVLPLGDVQYECGGYQAFLQSYDSSWGRLKSISHPVVGNHEYLTSDGTDCTSYNEGAAGYFRYFGLAAGNPSQGYYSYDIGTWHLIALNSNCGDAGGCGDGSPQAMWLAADLTAHPNLCTLAYWHIPLFSSGGRAANNTQVIWQILYNHDVDVILNGHDHIYERFAPQMPDGTPDTERGIREFVVGTGGANLTEIESIAANSEVLNNDTFGILKLTLHPASYDWQFVPETGNTFKDSGTEKCHGEPPVGTPPSALTQMVPAPTQTASPTPATTAFTFAPSADAYTSKPKPASNFGASNMLRLYGGPLGASYLRFDVENLPSTVVRATLRLYANNPSISGYQVRAVANNAWNESTITYGNAPPIGDLITVSEPFEAKQWTSVDLTSLVKGNGTYDIVLITFNATPFSLASRDAIPLYRPQLVVDVLAGSSTSPTATQTLDSTDSLE